MKFSVVIRIRRPLPFRWRVSRTQFDRFGAGRRGVKSVQRWLRLTRWENWFILTLSPGRLRELLLMIFVIIVVFVILLFMRTLPLSVSRFLMVTGPSQIRGNRLLGGDCRALVFTFSLKPPFLVVQAISWFSKFLFGRGSLRV